MMCFSRGSTFVEGDLDDTSIERICAFYLYSDGSKRSRGGRNFRTVTMFLAQPPLQDIRRKGQHLCFLQSIDGEELGLDMFIAAKADMWAPYPFMCTQHASLAKPMTGYRVLWTPAML